MCRLRGAFWAFLFVGVVWLFVGVVALLVGVVALFVGVLPIIGNVAYPLQILYCGTERDHELARFVFYDTFSRLGQKLPIWGGPDTLTEHLANRLPDIILHWRAPATRLSVSSPSPDTAL